MARHLTELEAAQARSTMTPIDMPYVEKTAKGSMTGRLK